MKVLPFFITFLSSLEISYCQKIKNAYKGDEEVALDCMRQFIDKTEKKDREGIKSLFSDKALEESKTMDEDIDYLFEYYKGENQTKIVDVCAGVSTDQHMGKKSRAIVIDHDIETTEDKYRLALDYCLFDDFDRSNEGLESIYIIRFNDDINAFAIKSDGTQGIRSYGGDGKWTYGINIGKVYVEEE